MTYRLTEQILVGEGGTAHRVYGVCCVEAANGTGMPYSADIPDLGCDRLAVEAFVDRCNRCSLSPIHLRDAAEDFLNR